MDIKDINLIISYLSTASGFRRLGSSGFITKDEALQSYDDLVQYALGSGAIDKDTAEPLRLLGREKPEQARGAKDRAIRMRDLIYELLRCGIEGESPPRDLIDSFNGFIAGPGKTGIRASEPAEHPLSGPFSFCFLETPDPLLPFLPALSGISFSLMTSPSDFQRLKICPGKDCGRIFYDASKNSSKRWCSMKTCGNRSKAAAHRIVKKSQKGLK